MPLAAPHKHDSVFPKKTHQSRTLPWAFASLLPRSPEERRREEMKERTQKEEWRTHQQQREDDKRLDITREETN